MTLERVLIVSSPMHSVAGELVSPPSVSRGQINCPSTCQHIRHALYFVGTHTSVEAILCDRLADTQVRRSLTASSQVVRVNFWNFSVAGASTAATAQRIITMTMMLRMLVACATQPRIGGPARKPV